MDKKLINEDISNMKYLFGYKPGRVISEQDTDFTTDTYLDVTELDEEGKRHPERLVKHINTGKLVGTHKYGRGFTPNRHGEELGFEHHPSSIPNKTKFGGTEVGDFDYEDDEGQDMDTGEELYPSFSSDRKFMGMSKSMSDMEIDEESELEESNPFRNSNGFEDYNFPEELKDRLSDIYDLLDEVMEDPEYNPSDYSDGYDFAQDVIGGVLSKLRDEFGEDFEEYEDDVDDYLRNNEDETILDFYNSRSDFEDDEDEDNLFEQEEPETDRYMFFSNLQQIHRQMGILLEKDPEMIHSILDNGHDWAQDHIATAKESIDQVFDFIMNEEEGDEDVNNINEQEDDGDYEEESVISILKKHHLLDNVVEPDNKKILLRNQSSKVVQKILSLLPSFTELTFLAIMNCESADFSGVDICGLPELAFVNLNGTENNFEEQGYECAETDDSPFYFIQ